MTQIYVVTEEADYGDSKFKQIMKAYSDEDKAIAYVNYCKNKHEKSIEGEHYPLRLSYDYEKVNLV